MYKGLMKRIIPCLDIRDGRTVKGVNFENIRDAGDPVELAMNYAVQGADELVFLDITATLDKRKTFTGLVRQIARHLNIPFTVGGGISAVADASRLLEAGADKISVNSAAVRNPQLVDDLARQFGNQFVVVAIDTRFNPANQTHFVHTHGGSKPTALKTLDWAREAESRGAGEILLTSMDTDGVKNGFDIPVTKLIAENTGIPLIASGGAGKPEHFMEVFMQTNADAALAASIFHFGEVPVPNLKNYLSQQNIPVR